MSWPKCSLLVHIKPCQVTSINVEITGSGLCSGSRNAQVPLRGGTCQVWCDAPHWWYRNWEATQNQEGGRERVKKPERRAQDAISKNTLLQVWVIYQVRAPKPPRKPGTKHSFFLTSHTDVEMHRRQLRSHEKGSKHHRHEPCSCGLHRTLAFLPLHWYTSEISWGNTANSACATKSDDCKYV